MIRVLEKAFHEASKLTEHEQDAFGEWLLSEIQSERTWDNAFASSQDLLARLAKEAVAEHRGRPLATGRLLKLHQRRIAQTAIGPSALRGQGKGSVGAARDFLESVKLSSFVVSDHERFNATLNRETARLQEKLPNRAWGTARKALNLFLRDVLYSRYLCEDSEIMRIEPWLEIPLDAQVANAIRDHKLGQHLSPWTTIKALSKSDSNAYQVAAEAIARGKGIARVHLDLLWWRSR